MEKLSVPRYGNISRHNASLLIGSTMLTGEISRELTKALRFAITKGYPSEFIDSLSNICYLVDEHSHFLTACASEELFETPAQTDNDTTDCPSLESKYIHHTATHR